MQKIDLQKKLTAAAAVLAMIPFKSELTDYLDYYNNRRIKSSLAAYRLYNIDCWQHKKIRQSAYNRLTYKNLFNFV